MRVLYVIEHLSVKGGLERILTSKINALSERGHEVVLLTVWKEDKATAFPIDGRVKHYCLDINRPGSMFAYPLTLVRVLRRFNNIVKTIQPDVTILFRAMGAWIAGWTSWKGRMIFESHGARWSNNHIWLYPRMEQRVESVVCLTKGDAQEYKKACRVAVIPNFTEIVPAGEPDYKARHVIFVGRRCPEKNIERLEKTGVPVIAVHRGCGHKPCWNMAHTIRLARPDIPMLLDPSHMSGDAAQVPALLEKVAELDLDGAMIEVHCHPEAALSDNAQQLTPTRLRDALDPLLSRLCLASLICPSDDQKELNWFRAEIDELDDRLWGTIAARMEVSRRIGEWKKAHGVAPLQPERYQQIVERLRDTDYGLPEDFILKIWELIHEQSLRVQEV